ncbi:Type I secretion system membrane fusion protein PrsE [Sinobacterium norvegicum]|uniref:Membrane fusion protein (MFP) family protein n=1 Tax=Sinobacterium norvegicum TaxID=1641715 RepID=A0ABM9AJK8_9GAMM|nr:HlyD family type I secretion periplasmic adaptor subunit [Sinobacterium norvegicum]CAH0993430.1 Type I secretion system membrane fusion protein PrsE [Sinobacterium norvegicum]
MQWSTIVNRIFPQDDSISEQDLPYMSSVSEALIEKTPHGPQKLFRLIFLIFIVLVLWGSFAEVDEFTRGLGKVVPSKDIQIIQNLEGGILSELLVYEGEVVEQGQPLLRIDDTRFSSTMRETGLQLAYLRTKVKRLQAESKGVVFATPSEDADLFYQREYSLYQSRRFEYNNQVFVATEKITQKNLELKELNSRLGKLKSNEKLLAKEYRLTEPLILKGAVSQVDVIRLERSLNDMRGERRATEIAIPRVAAELNEVEAALESVSLRFKASAQAELNEAQATLSQMEETSRALDDRVERTLVLAPVKGTVKQINIHTIGGIIQPGMDLIEIVPFEDQLMVEVQVRPSDIAFIHPGQRASVKVTAYDFSIHGDLKGEVVNLSPDTITDEKGNSFYLAKILTDSTFLTRGDEDLPIIPGMTVEAGILTGKKTIMAYLLKPILKTKNAALSER